MGSEPQECGGPQGTAALAGHGAKEPLGLGRGPKGDNQGDLWASLSFEGTQAREESVPTRARAAPGGRGLGAGSAGSPLRLLRTFSDSGWLVRDRLPRFQTKRDTEVAGADEIPDKGGGRGVL